MIRKLATIPGVRYLAFFMTVLMGIAVVQAQQPSAQQPPAAQPQTQQQPDQSSSQEASPEETTRPRNKPRDYKKWTFNVGGGASLPNGTTNTYVRGGGGIAAAGAARNYSRYFGLRLDFQFDNLPLRTSALELAQAPGATDHVYSLMLDPIINVPASKNWGGYLVFGPSFLHRSGKLDSSAAVPGSACNGFFTWWGHCFDGSLPINGNFLHSSQNEFGYNFGGGITRKIRPNMDLYVEFRYLHGKHNNITTDLRPITIGIRW
ncbi:MAG: outer membrane beta-barrel protein [Acidobacteriia bacterium]|nr:outer membrane beta-barrel protein [Terriglobia bacterium]